MSNILSDIVEDIEIKPNKSKVYLKWIVRIAVVCVSVAFVLGQLKIKNIHKIEHFQSGIDSNRTQINNLKIDVNNRFKIIDEKVENNNKRIDDNNKRIDKIYDKLIEK